MVSVAVAAITAALTILYPDSIPLAIYLIEPGASALRDASIPLMRAIANGIIWGLAAYIFVRVPERLRHKG